MRLAVFLLVGAVAACGLPEASGEAPPRSDTRQVPSNYTPGIHISGHANIGVVRSF